MKFTTVAEAFNFYRNHSLAEMETRAAQIKGTVDTDPNADITSINIEIEGLQQAMNNSKEKENKHNKVKLKHHQQTKERHNVANSIRLLE